MWKLQEVRKLLCRTKIQVNNFFPKGGAGCLVEAVKNFLYRGAESFRSLQNLGELRPDS